MLNPTKHPSDELLVAYLEAYLESPEHQVVADHVRGCNRCVELLGVVQRRLALDAEVGAPVPAALRLRAAGLGVAPRQPAPTGDSLWARLSRRWAPLFELPVLAPASFAFGVVLMLGVLRFGSGPTPPANLMRSVVVDGPAVIAVDEALVRSAPQTQAPIVSRLVRGQRLDIVGTKDDWAQVTLADGAKGWIERQTLE